MTRPPTTPALVRRHLRFGPGASVTVAALILLLATIAVLVPPLVGSVLDSSTRYRLDILSPSVRDLSTSFAGVPVAESSPVASETLPAEYQRTWGSWDAVLQGTLNTAPEEVRSAHASAEYFTRLGAPGPFVPTTYVVLDPRFASRIDLVDGRMPQPTVTDDEWLRVVQGLFDENGRLIEPAPTEVPATEVVLSAAAADEVSWRIGETRVVGAEAAWSVPVPLTLVGIFEPVDASDPYWARAPDILEPSVGFDPDGVPYVRTTAFAAPELLSTVVHLSGGRFTEAWYALLPERVTSDAAPQLLAELRGFVATAHPLPGNEAGPLPSLSFQSGAVGALEEAIAQSRSFVAVLAMLAAGPLGVAAAVLVLGCRMILEHRRPAVELLAARGAAPGQLRGVLGIEGLIAGVVPAAIGTAVGLALAAGLTAGPVSATPALFAVPVALALLPAVVTAASATRSRSRTRADAPARRSGWRPVVEAAVVALAVIATATLVVRGAGDPAAPLDPLVVVAPLLLALVACLITLRLYPGALRLVLARERGGRGFVGMLGAARALRDPATGLAPVLALIVGVSFAVTSGVLLSTVQSGAVEASRAATGADLQLEASRFEDGAAEAVAGLDGVAQVAPMAVLRASVLFADDSRSRVPLYLVDRTLLDEVQSGYPPIVPADVALGDGTGPVPLLLSATVAAQSHAASAELEIAGAPATLAGVADGEVPFSATTSWALADIAYAGELGEDDPLTTRIFVRLEPGADAAAVSADALELLGSGVRATTPEDVLAELGEDPATAGLRGTLIVGIALSALLTAVAVVMTLVLGGRARRRILALLQTLGAPPRSGGGLVAWELAPAMIGALVVGTACGAALPVLLLSVIDLTPFTGGDRQPAYSADPVVLLIAVGGFIAVTAIFTLVALAITRRARTAAVLRTVEET